MQTGLPGQPRSAARVFRSVERLWSCHRCGFVNSGIIPRCSACDEQATSPGDAVDAIVLEPAPELDHGGREVTEEHVGQVVSEPGILPEVEMPPGALADPLAAFDRHTPEDSDTEASTSESDKRTWETSLFTLVGRLAAPATFLINGTLTGVFVLTGLGIGACAGVVASSAGNGGVIRSAGIGAVAGAAASVHILDLGRHLLRGNSIAAAEDSRAMRGTRVDEVNPRVGGRAARVRTALRARAAAHHPNAHISSAARSIERALLGGDVELVLNQLLTGMVESPNSVHTGVIDPSTGGFNSLSHSSSSSDVTRGAGASDPGGNPDRSSSAPHLHQLLEAILVQANVDDMSYEELLDRFGPGIEGPAAAPAAAVRAVPRRRLDGDDVEALMSPETRSTERACCVCLEDYGKGDTVKTLPRCGHRFHAHCIDRWLLCRNACPVCRVGLEVPATEGPPGPAAAAA